MYTLKEHFGWIGQVRGVLVTTRQWEEGQCASVPLHERVLRKAYASEGGQGGPAKQRDLSVQRHKVGWPRGPVLEHWCRGAGLVLADDSIPDFFGQRIVPIPTPFSSSSAEASGLHCGVE